MNLTDKITRSLSIPAIGATMIVEPALLGGAYLTGKSGIPPTGIYWDTTAAIGMGIVSIVCQTLVLSIAVDSQNMSKGIRRLLISCFMLTFLSFLAVMPVYMQASQLGLSVPETIEWFLPNGPITLLTFLYHSLIVLATQISPPMLLIAMKSNERAEMENETTTRVRRSTEDKEMMVLDAIRAYGDLGASTAMIKDDVSMAHSTCRKVIVDLVDSDKLTECQISGKTKMYRVV